MKKMTYYIHYTDRYNCAAFTKINTFIKELHEYIENMVHEGNKNISVFNFDTWNTSEPEGLVMFDKNNNYWNNFKK